MSFNYTTIVAAFAGLSDVSSDHRARSPSSPWTCGEGGVAQQVSFNCPHVSFKQDAVTPAGYMFTYWNSKASKEREAQIDRVNAQVGGHQGNDIGVCAASRLRKCAESVRVYL